MPLPATTIQNIRQIAQAVINELSGGNPATAAFLNDMYSRNIARLLDSLEYIYVQRGGAIDRQTAAQYLHNELAGMLNQYMQQQQQQRQMMSPGGPYQSMGYQNTMNSNVYGQQQIPPQQYSSNFAHIPSAQSYHAGAGGMAMDPNAIQAANSRSRNVQDMRISPDPPQVKREYEAVVEYEEPPRVVNVTRDVPTVIEAEESEEDRYVQELKMLNSKDCKTVMELSFDNKDDAIKKLVYNSSDDIEIATLYTGEIRSRGFRNAYSIKQYIEDELLSEQDSSVYTSIKYTKLHGLRIDNAEGVKLFSEIKGAFVKSKIKPRDQLVKIKEVLDGATRLAGDNIDKFIIGYINTYTKLGYLERNGDYSDIVFDSISDILGILGPVKPDKFVKLWLNTKLKQRIESILTITLRLLSTIRVYSLETPADIPFIMSSIGSKLAEDGATLRTIESDLLQAACDIKLANDELQSNLCYGEIKKYTVVGVDATIIYTTCSVEFLREGKYIDPASIIIDGSDIDTRFEYFVSNHSGDCDTAEVIIRQTPGIYIAFDMYIEGANIRIIPML